MADESAVVQFLRDDPTVNAVVEGRVYAELRTERDPMPAIAVELVIGTPVNLLGARPSVDRRLVLVTCYAKTRQTARQLSYVARDCLQNYGYLLDEGPVAYDADLKSWETQLQFSFWQRR